MEDRDQTELNLQAESDSAGEAVIEEPTPVLDMEMFAKLRDVVRSHYLWQWDDADKPTEELIKNLTTEIRHDPHFRLVGDIDLDESVFEVTLWLEESMAYSLASVDLMMLDALQIDFSRCAILARELTKHGLEYHLLTFGEGRAQQFRINIIGPRMQQIRDLGTLVAPTMDTFSA